MSSSGNDGAHGRHHSLKSTEYTQEEMMSELENMTRSLNEINDRLYKCNVKCHILEVDLATQFSPYMVEKVRNVKQDCKRCTAAIEVDTKATA